MAAWIKVMIIICVFGHLTTRIAFFIEARLIRGLVSTKINSHRNSRPIWLAWMRTDQLEGGVDQERLNAFSVMRLQQGRTSSASTRRGCERGYATVLHSTA